MLKSSWARAAALLIIWVSLTWGAHSVPPSADSTFVVTTDSAFGIKRLFSLRNTQAKEGGSSAYSLPLDEKSIAIEGGSANFGAQTLTVTSGPGGGGILLNTPFATHFFNVLVITMKTGTKGDFSVRVVTREDAGNGIAQPITFTARGSGEFKTYEIPLSGHWPFAWASQVEQIAISWDAQVPSVEFAAVELDYHPEPPISPGPDSLPQMPTLPPANYDWDLTAPANARFIVYPGTVGGVELKKALNGRDFASDGVSFTVRVLLQESGEIVAEEQVQRTVPADPEVAQKPIVIDLSAHANRKLRIELRVAHGVDANLDYAYWGNPMVAGEGATSVGMPIILISNDTLRQDHVGCYGYARDTTPNVDAFAKDAVLFEDALTTATWTLPAHISMLTGLSPTKHRVTPGDNLPRQFATMPQLLQDKGYLTLGVTGFSWWLLGSRGFARGMDYYDATGLYRPFTESLSETYRLLDQYPTARFFLFLHNYDIHSKLARDNQEAPYSPPDPAFAHFSKDLEIPQVFRQLAQEKSESDEILAYVMKNNVKLDETARAFIIAGYDDSIRYVDHHLGAFFQYLKDRGIYDSALIILTSDHGESFGEHGDYMHSHAYENLARIPLIVKFPGNSLAGRRVPGQVILEDIMPTVLALAGLPMPKETSGLDLAALIESKGKPHEIVFIKGQKQKAVRMLPWKYLVSDSGKELYNLEEDPAEKTNVLKSASPIIPPMMQRKLDDEFNTPQSGWNFRFSSNGIAAQAQLRLTAAFRFQKLQLLDFEKDAANPQEKDAYEISQDLSQLNLKLQVAPGSQDFAILNMNETNEGLRLSLAPTANVTLQIGSQPAQPISGAEIVLDPENPDAHKPEKPAVPPQGQALLAIWYEPGPETGQFNVEMDEDMRQKLEGLGYLGGN